MYYDLTEKLTSMHGDLRGMCDEVGNLPFDYDISEEFIDELYHLEQLLDKVSDEVDKLQKLSRKEGY